ncbi:MAG: heme ABC exporter ATP-binding protein CcmA [Myxococcota bacterium]|nr:heme ABC exporter ATP-binding protein CcmA [Myxococcota bacterium]
MDDFAIEVNDLSRRYGRRWALQRLHLEVARGEILMVAGPNGAGKSTLLRVLSTISRPDTGTVRIFGLDVVNQRLKVRQRISLLDHRHFCYGELSAWENLELSGRPGGMATEEVVELIGLKGREQDPLGSFSAGMKKRLALGRVLCQGAEVVLLDEPYAGLDPEGFGRLEGIFASLAERGATVLISTHQVARVAPHCHRALVLREGKTAWLGPANELPHDGELWSRQQ